MPGNRIIVIGASAGGVEILKQLVAGLPADLPAAIFVVLHISPFGNSVLPNILNRAGTLKAVHPEDKETIQPGRIYVARPDRHLLIEPGYVRVSHGPRENGTRPAIDPLFRTAARAYGSQVVGVVLSGTLDNGTAGLLAVKMQGGVAIVQDPDDAPYNSMPLNAIESVDVDQILPVSEIPAALVRLTHRPVTEEIAPVSEEMEYKAEIAVLAQEAMNTDEKPGKPSEFVCPDCGGVLWESEVNHLVHYRCRTGHAFSEESLLAQQSETLEEALWAAYRALQESASLNVCMAKRATKSGRHRMIQHYQDQAKTAQQRAEVIRKSLLDGIDDNKRQRPFKEKS